MSDRSVRSADPGVATHKVYMIILCGAGDRPIQRLGGQTPLAFAETPNLDRLAREGVSGLLSIIDGEITPESDSGAMALLGYDPLVHYTGRGALEGFGMGFWDGEGAAAAFRINFASQNRRSGHLDRRTARDVTDEELQTLAAEIRANVRLQQLPELNYEMTAFGRHRGILCFKSPTLPLSGNVSNTDPGFRRVGAFGVPNQNHRQEPSECVALDGTEGAAITARAVNEFVRESAEVLAVSATNARRVEAGKLPANIILFRDGGHELPELGSFLERTGLTLSLYGQVPAEHGLCKLIGGRFSESKPAAGQSDAAYYIELVGRLAADPAGLVFVHLKGADEPGHDDQPEEKAAAIELIDRHMVGELLHLAGPEDTIVITGDHATPCELGIHATDPVPTVVRRAGIEPDTSRQFSEIEAAHGGLPVERATGLLPHLIQAVAKP